MYVCLTYILFSSILPDIIICLMYEHTCILVPSGTKTDLKIYVDLSELHFTLQRFLPYTCILKTIWYMNIILGILVPRSTKIDLIICIDYQTYILCSSDFVLYLEDY